MKRQYDKNFLVNETLCSECKHVCCERCGCSYFPEDFEFDMSFENLKSEIDKGFISIGAMYGTETPTLKLLKKPIYYLRVRNVNEDSPIENKNGICKRLVDHRCFFPLEARPSGGKYYIPFKRGCYTLYTDKEFIDLWAPYQNVLMLLLKHYKN